MTRKLFILVPSDSPAGPVKGAYALANALAEICEVTLVALKRGPGADSALDTRVRHLCLADAAEGLSSRISSYRTLLRKAGGRAGATSLSMCLSADVVNMLCGQDAVTCASVRGNLLANYRHDYGLIGVPLAIAHLFVLRMHDRVVAMNRPMASQIRFYSGIEPDIIENFVDEAPLEKFRSTNKSDGSLRFVFVGSLSKRKQPWLILLALKQLIQEGVSARVDFVGNGPLRDYLQSEIARLGLEDAVVLHGFVADPAPIMAGADSMVLPSLSEGISRAALEALYLGVPCVLRDADGNAELIEEGVNGALFRSDNELSSAMLHSASFARKLDDRCSLLPESYRQATASLRYLNLLESIQ